MAVVSGKDTGALACRDIAESGRKLWACASSKEFVCGFIKIWSIDMRRQQKKVGRNFGLGQSGLRRRLRRAVVLESLEPRVLLSANFMNVDQLPLGAESLVESLLGDGVTAENMVYTGAGSAAGIFDFGGQLATDIGIGEGVILSSGNIAHGGEGNISDSTSTNHGTDGDLDLMGLVNDQTYDAAVLEFDFTPSDNHISFQYVFASEEYNEFVDSSFNDVFAFFLDGVNIAFVPGTETPVAIKTVNNAVNSQYFNDNDYGDFDGNPPYDTVFDGFTDIFYAQAIVTPGESHHIKLAIADTADHSYDSAVFIKGSTFNSDSVAPTVYFGGTSNVTAPGLMPKTFDVTYDDNVGIDLGSLGDSDIVIWGPGEVAYPASLVSMISGGGDVSILATYEMIPPGGAWDGADNGLYVISLQPNEVVDTSNNPVAGQTLGGFGVSIDESSDPAEISVIYGGGQLVDGQAGVIDLGCYECGAPATEVQFRVINTGDETLTLDSLILPAGFLMGSNGLAGSLAGGANDTFTILADTSAEGAWSGQLEIGSNDDNENPFNFGIRATVEPSGPELDVFAGYSEVLDGQGDAIGFADVVCGGPGSQVVFTLMNTGSDTLLFDTFDVPNGFSIVSDLPGELAAGGSVDLTVELNAEAAGLKQGQVVIGSNDEDEDPFNFPVSGMVCGPEIEVSGPGGEIEDGQAGIIDYDTAMPGAVVEYTYTVSNDGNADLSLDSLELPSGFYAVGSLPGSLAPGASAQVTIGLNTSAAGSFGGQVVIGNNDSDENPFNFPVVGEVASSEIAVFLGDTLIVDGATETIDFGEINEGSAGNELTFLVRNLGNAPLSLDGINVPAGFTVTEGLVGSLLPGGSDEFTVRLDSGAAGDYAGDLSFGNSDADENPFNFAIAGQVFGAVPHEGNYAALPSEGGSYVLVSLSGPGEFDVFTSPSNPLRVENIVVTGSAVGSMLQVVLVGAGEASVGDIQVDGALGLAMLNAVTLTGALDIADTVDALFLDDVGAEAQVSAGDWSWVGTTVMAQAVGDGACFDIPGRVNLFRAASFEQGTLTAGCFGSIVVGSGDFGVDVTAELGNIGSLLVPQGDVTGRLMAAYDVGRIMNLTGSFSATLRARRLGMLISNDMDGAFLSVAERADIIMLRHDVVDSHVLIGYDMGMDGAIDSGEIPGDDHLGAGQLRFFSYGGTFANSHLALGVVPVHSPLFDGYTGMHNYPEVQVINTTPSHGYIMGNGVTTDNGGQLFGLYYDGGIGSILQTTLQPAGDFVIVDGL
ncbi:MAG: choice-of-anchor L domain-containing protein [Sedimentisphaerales bacterium]|nr:choice-of-anchor L domain-containing protein [Sedimentisphaerales bacterium]